MSKIKKISIILLFLFSQILFGQSDNLKKNYVFYEVMGHSRNILSINYERTIIKINDSFNITIRTGIGYDSGKVEEEKRKINTLVTIPNVLSLQIGKRLHFANLGVGYLPTFASNLKDDRVTPEIIHPKFDSAFSISLGYRFVSDNIMFQVFPVFINSKHDGKIFSGGLSIGYTW